MKINTVNGNVIMTRPEKEAELLPESISSVQVDVATIVFESMQDKQKIAQLETDLGNALLEIMALKMGGI